MNRYTVAVLVNNQFGVLNRVTSMFRRRQFNIISLTVSETESNALSRITVTFEGGETQKQQLVNQLYKLPDVCSIKEFTPDTSVSCELMLIKLKNDSKTRSDILAAADAFGAKQTVFSRFSRCTVQQDRNIHTVKLSAIAVRPFENRFGNLQCSVRHSSDR